MDKSAKRTHVQNLVEAWSLGLMFPIAIGIGFLWGYWMDKWFHTWPWLTAIFTVFGVAAAFINLFRIGLKNDRSTRKPEQR